MNITILGTGTSEGMPAPLCSCDPCQSTTRTRTSIAVETDTHTLVFDATPDITRQLHSAQITDVDSIFLTHHHHDHTSGLKELVHTTREGDVAVKNNSQLPDTNNDWFGQSYHIYSSYPTFSKIQHELSYVFSQKNIQKTRFSDGDTVKKGSLRITAISATHTDGYLAYVIQDTKTDELVLYHPDYGEFDGSSFSDKYKDTVFDCLICDVSSLLGYNIHATKYEFEDFLKVVPGRKFVGMNVSEHIAQCSTTVLENRASRYDIAIVPDGTQLDLN